MESIDLSLSLRDLGYLAALADTRHFGRAAEACHVSQPTLSAQLKKLEQRLGVALVERNARPIRLTPVGEEVAERARRMLAEARQIRALSRDQQDPMAGRLTLGLIPTVAPYLLSVAAPRLREAFPRLTLLLAEHQTHELLRRLDLGTVDLGILALPVDGASFEALPLYDERFLVAVPSDHPLADADEVAVDDLAGERLLLLEDGHCLRDQALEVCSQVDVTENQDFRATSLETLRQMVAAGVGTTLLPELAVTRQLSAVPGLVVKPFASPAPTRTIAAVWRHKAARRETMERVAEAVRESVRATLDGEPQ